MVRERIVQAGGDPGRVRVVAVTKGFEVEAVQAALGAGLCDVGENYAAELVAKAGAFGAGAGAGSGAGGAGGAEKTDAHGVAGEADVVWHFLGAVQRNKVAELAPVVGVWQSVAREAEGARIARFRPGATVLVQVDATGLPGRNGCPPDEVEGLVQRLRAQGLDVRGLMTVAAPGEEKAEAAFGVVARLADRLGLPERSMGMSDDLESAVRSGTTMVRIGRALFGDRPPPADGAGRRDR